MIAAFRIIILLTLILCGFGFSEKSEIKWKELSPQDAAKRLTLLRKEFTPLNNYSAEITYRSFRGHFAIEEYDKSNGKVYRLNDCFRSEALGRIVIQNKKVRINIDSVSKKIMITNPSNISDFEVTEENFLTLLKTCKKVKYSKSNAGIAFRFELVASRGPVIQEIFYEKGLLTKLVCYYANDHDIRENDKILRETVFPRVEIEFLNYNVVTPPSKDVFVTDQIVTFHNKKISTGPKFKSYKILDGRFKK